MCRGWPRQDLAGLFSLLLPTMRADRSRNGVQEAFPRAGRSVPRPVPARPARARTSADERVEPARILPYLPVAQQLRDGLVGSHGEGLDLDEVGSGDLRLSLRGPSELQTCSWRELLDPPELQGWLAAMAWAPWSVREARSSPSFKEGAAVPARSRSA